MRVILPLLCLALTACSDPGCSNDILSHSTSPDGKTKLLLFSRNCGATTGPNTQATILPQDGRFTQNTTGNTFIIDQGTATVSWKDSGNLLVTFSHGSRIYKQESSVEGITIEYQTNAP